jgi:hypothetical protein
MKKRYAIRTRFTFTGTFLVNADTKAEAKECVKNNCGLDLGGKIHTCLSEEDVDWDFPIHPEKQIIRIWRDNEKKQKISV